VLALSLIAACSLVKPVETPVDKQSRARTLASEGKHADAARTYAELAADIPADHDNYELLSAEQWVAAGDLPAAKQALAAVSADARSKLPASRALVAAEIAVAEGDGAGAIHELDSIGVPTSGDLAQNYWYLRGEGAFLTGHPVEGTRAFIERERFLPDPAGLRASREELFNKIRNAAEHGQSLKPPPNTDSVVAGWLQLGPVALELQRDPMHAPAALENWRTTTCWRSPAARSPSPPSFPIRSRCSCRCRAAPKRSAWRCATVSSPRISNRTPPRVRG
jgi:outer membrane PBP1 activator LpoA protein